MSLNNTELSRRTHIVKRRNFDPIRFARLLAKIAHSFAVAELGLTGFNPFLHNLIRGIPPLYPFYYVGGSFSELISWPEIGTDLHRLEIELKQVGTAEAYPVISG